MRRRVATSLALAAVFAITAVAAATEVAAADAEATKAEAMPTGRCAPPRLGKGTGEGLNDPAQFPPAEGEFRIGMLFVEFADARGMSDPGAIYDRFIPHVVEWYRNVSYGRLRLVVTPVRRWVTLPSRAGDYGATGDLERGMRVALEEVVAAVDGEFDFDGYDALYLVLPTSALGKIGSVGALVSDEPIVADTARIHVWAWLVADELGNQTKDFAAYVVHETGHLLGLPDLYVTGSPRTFNLWDAMAWGSGSSVGGMFAWHRWKLGWLDARQVACLNGRRRVDTVVTPLERPGGRKAVIYRGTDSAHVAEVRQRLHEDAAICRTGVLIYRVAFRAPAGSPDIHVLRASSDQSMLDTCGPDAAAPFQVIGGGTTRVRVGNLRFDLLRALPDGSYRIRVTRGR
jgi:M6 family metalloprotease-like protein